MAADSTPEKPSLRALIALVDAAKTRAGFGN